MHFLSPQARFRMYLSIKNYVDAFINLICNKSMQGDYTLQLENKLKEQDGYALCTPSGRMAIYIAMKAAIAPGKEVILSPNTIADVINMVICAGAKPVFCDIDPMTGNMDPAKVAELCTENTAAIFITHLYGLISGIDEFKKIAEEKNVLLIEDAAQAFGAEYNGKKAASIGDIGIFSFGRAKNITGFAGGMLLTKHEQIAKEAQIILNSFPAPTPMQTIKKIIFGCLIKDVASSDLCFPHILFPVFKWAYAKKIKAITKLIETELDLSLKTSIPNNYQLKLSELQANTVLKNLENVNTDFKHRLKLVQMYHDGLKDIEGLKLPPLLTDASHVYNYYPIQYENRMALRAHMLEQGRDIALQHIKNTADLPAFKEFYADCPNCRKWANETIMLPNYAKYRPVEVERNILAIRKFFNK